MGKNRLRWRDDPVTQRHYSLFYVFLPTGLSSPRSMTPSSPRSHSNGNISIRENDRKSGAKSLGIPLFADHVDTNLLSLLGDD